MAIFWCLLCCLFRDYSNFCQEMIIGSCTTVGFTGLFLRCVRNWVCCSPNAVFMWAKALFCLSFDFQPFLFDFCRNFSSEHTDQYWSLLLHFPSFFSLQFHSSQLVKLDFFFEIVFLLLCLISCDANNVFHM